MFNSGKGGTTSHKISKKHTSKKVNVTAVASTSGKKGSPSTRKRGKSTTAKKLKKKAQQKNETVGETSTEKIPVMSSVLIDGDDS